MTKLYLDIDGVLVHDGQASEGGGGVSTICYGTLQLLLAHENLEEHVC